MSNQHTTINVSRKLRRIERAIEAVLSSALFIALCGIGKAHADVTFGASVTKADETLTTTLTWDAPGASGCVGAGHPSWNGAKTAAGIQELPPITLSGTYSLTLTCSFPGDTTARVTWTPPTQNTDGSVLANLAGYTLLWGDSATALSQMVEIADPGANVYTVVDLSAGPKYFAVKAYNSVGVESALSNVASKVITAPTSNESSISLTVNPRPREATDVAVE